MKINRTRERILDKSIELFNRKQASNVSTVQISTALEISPGNLYYYYTNKEEVIRCTWKERMVPEITEILETAEEINDKKDLEQYLKKFLAHYAKFRFFYTERTTMFYNDDEMEDLYVETAAQEKETLEAVFNRWAGEGKADFSKEDAKLLADSSMILLEALAADNKNAGEVEEGDKEFQTYADKALSYVMAALGTHLKKEKGQKVKFIVYVVVRVLVVLALIRQIWEHDWHDVMLCGMTLILLFLPTVLSKQLALRLPNVLEIIIVVFIFAAEILGEVHGFYVIFPNWDDILHTTNGFLAAAIGIALVDVLNQHENVKLNLSPAFVAVVSFCFSMTIGVLWEFFECSMDMFCGTDMQKDTWISAFNSVAINPDGVNVPVHVDVDSVTVNGQVWQQYLDIGLYDTMQDLFVNFIGAVVFSIIGYIYIKNRGRGIAAEFIPTMDMKKFEEIKEEHQEELDHLLHDKLKLSKKEEKQQTDDTEKE